MSKEDQLRLYIPEQYGGATNVAATGSSPESNLVIADDQIRFYLPNIIDTDMSHAVIAKLDTVVERHPEAPITLHVDTYGGSVDETLELVEYLQHIPNPLTTKGGSKVQSAGVMILAAGDEGRRYARDDTQFMIHQVNFTRRFDQVPAPEFYRQAKLMLTENRRYMGKMAELMRYPLRRLLEETQHDLYFGAQMAKDKYHVIDHVIPRKK